MCQISSEYSMAMSYQLKILQNYKHQNEMKYFNNTIKI